MEFIKQRSQKDGWDTDEEETIGGIPTTTFVFWYNSQSSNGCGVFLKEGTLLLDIVRTADYFEFTSESTTSLKIRAKTSASGGINVFCIRP